MKRTLYMSTSVLALVCCSAAYAQTTSAGSTTTSASTGKVEEVVVTAERRSVSLQKSNIAATVLTGQDLSEKGVNVVDNLQFIAPSVTVDNFGQGIDFDIRGIGKGEHNSQTTPGVITYRDGVATFPGYITEEPYFDVSSLEILRGPQGTFAGQNAIGGAVFVTTNNPVIGGGYDGYALAQIGNYTDFGTQGAVNLPIDDTMAARFAWFGETRNSFFDITTPSGTKYSGNPGNARWGAGRFSYLWQPNQSLTILFKTDFGLLDNGAYPADPFSDRFKTDPYTGAPNPNYTDLFKIRADAAQQAQDEYVRSSLKVDYVFGGGITLQSISAYQLGNTAYKADLYGNLDTNLADPLFGMVNTDTPGFGFVDNVDETILSEEVNLISPDKGWFTWVLGAFAQSDDYDFLPPAYKNFVIGVPTGSPLTEYALQGKNPESDLSAFGQVNFNLPAGFQIQLGGRYSSVSTQNKDVDIYQYGLFLPDNQTLKDSNFSYKAALNWNVNDDNLLYAFIATGFKPGGLNVPVGIGIPAPFIPETDTDYEAGWKSTLFDGHLRTQLDGYWNDFKDFQVTIAYPDFPTFPFEVNVPGKTKIYGAEGSAQAVFGAFAFDVGVGLQHSAIGTFYSADPRVVLTTAVCNPQTGPATFACNNLTGHQQTYAPNFTFDLGAQYTFDLGDNDALTPRVDFGHQSAQWATLFENPDLGDRLAQRNILGAQLSWIRGEWNVTLYGTNLTDQHYVEALNSNLDFAGPPRQFGVRLTKTF